MSSVNRVFLLGRTTRDVEIRAMPSGSSVGSFAIAMNRYWNGSDGQRKEEITFVEISCFGKTADLCGQYLSKGQQVLIDGRLKLDKWQNAEGQNRSRLKVIAERVTFLGGKHGDDNVSREPGTEPPASTGSPPVNEDEIPF